MKTQLVVPICVIMLSIIACSIGQPSDQEIQTAIAKTQTAEVSEELPPLSPPTSSEEGENSVKNYEVFANQGWQSTGIYIEEGQQIFVEYVDGSWATRVGLEPDYPDIWTDAWGTGDEMFYPEIGIHASFGSLLGMTDDGQVFEIGGYVDYVSIGSGNFYLRMNDSDEGLIDNDGSVIVKIILGGIQTIESPTATSTVSPTEEIDICQANKWQIIPTIIEESIQGDGWKILQIELGIENGSQYWGKFSAGHPELITEGGFVYPTDNTLYHNSELTPNCQEKYNCNSQRNNLSLNKTIPPGFIAAGEGSHLLNLSFKVAESQNQYNLRLPYDVACYLPGGDNLGEWDNYEPILEIDLKSNLQQVSYPEYESIITVPNLLDQPIEITEEGILEFTGVERKVSQYGDTLFIHTKFTNANEGYESFGWLRGYLIGDNGYMYDISVYTQAGPGQAYEEIQEFEIPTNLKILKLVLPFWNTTGGTYGPKKSILQVLDIPEGIIQIRE